MDCSQRSASESYYGIRLPGASHLDPVKDDYRQDSNRKVDKDVDGTDEAPEYWLVYSQWRVQDSGFLVRFEKPHPIEADPQGDFPNMRHFTLKCDSPKSNQCPSSITCHCRFDPQPCILIAGQCSQESQRNHLGKRDRQNVLKLDSIACLRRYFLHISLCYNH